MKKPHWSLTASLIGAATVSLVALVVLPGCKTSARAISRLQEVDTSKYYAVSAEKTPFYQYGPQQGNGPDMELQRDTLVNLVRHSFGYSKVRLATTGQQGYVASEDIKPAPPVLVAALTATPPPIEQTTQAVESFDPAASTDFTPPPPEGLPEPDLPPPSPEATPL